MTGTRESTRVAGLLLAAGAGRRMGRPKALVRLGGEPLVLRAWRALGDAGLAPTVVVLGAAHTDAAAALPPEAETVVAPRWEDGMGWSLRAGLGALRAHDAAGGRDRIDAALISLVDTPGIGAAAMRRVAEAASGPGALARGAFGGRPGHPVVLGREHWAAVAELARGDVGARDYLRGRRDLMLVEIGDVADPGDVDTPAGLEAHLGAHRGHGRS